MDKNDPHAPHFKEEIVRRKQEFVTAFEALRRRRSATVKDQDETFFAATSWPWLWTEVVSDFSHEQADQGKRIFGLLKSAARPQPIEYRRDGKQYLVRDLVLGTLRVLL